MQQRLPLVGQVRARPSEKLVLVPHPEHDPSGFGDVAALSTHVAGFGCHGGVRLLMAACHCFARYAADRGLVLPSRTFALSYETCIPRQSGLSGSSAIVLATLWCLLDIHGLGEDARATHDMPYVALQAEQSLGITAGLQDRLIQTYGGCLLMDFSGAGRPRLTVIDTAGRRIHACRHTIAISMHSFAQINSTHVQGKYESLSTRTCSTAIAVAHLRSPAERQGQRERAQHSQGAVGAWRRDRQVRADAEAL